MAVEVGRGEIPISADMDGFTKDVSRKAAAVGEDAGKKLNTGMAPQLKQLGAAIGGVFAAQQAAQFVGGAISAASDLNETVSKSRTIFGPAAADLEKWADGAAKAMGQSKQGALDAAGTFGNLFVQLKIAPDLAAKMSKEMVGLASDFASFHNANPADVINAQTAAFRGEYDALQRFVPTINAAAVEQKALEMSGKSATKELTLQEKALAVNALMMEGAGDAAGDFARTSDGLANKQRIQSAQWADLTAKIGGGLLPIMTAFTTFVMEKVIPAISGLATWVGENIEVLAAVATVIAVAVLPRLIAMGVQSLIAGAKMAAAWILGLGPIALIAAAVAAFAFLVIKNWDTIKDVTEAVFSAVVGFVKGAIDWVRNNWPLLLAILTGPIGLAVLAITRNWDTIKDGFTAVKNWISDRIDDVVGFFTGMPGRLAAIGSTMFDFIKTAFRGAINYVIDGWNALEFKIPGFDPPGPGPSFGGFTLGVPNIPRLHAGGIYDAPPGMDEGLALLRSNEVVSTPEDMGTVVAKLDKLIAAVQHHEQRLVALARQ